MKWTEDQIKHIIADLAEENSLACRSLFHIAAIEFTETVDTMAVTLADKPLLLINIKFCQEKCITENDVKALLLHEFMHVLLGHTITYKENNPILNIALDAIINAIIHRSFGSVYSDFYQRYYEGKGLLQLLIPNVSFKPEEDEFLKAKCYFSICDVHSKIYQGRYCTDELYELLDFIYAKTKQKSSDSGSPKSHQESEGNQSTKSNLIGDISSTVFLGNHTCSQEISKENEVLLDETLQKTEESLIGNDWKPGKGTIIKKKQELITHDNNRQWYRSTYKILKECLMEDLSRRSIDSKNSMIPILHPSNRRSLSKFCVTGLIPLVTVPLAVKLPSKSTVIYLDVSGSMNEEIDRLISLLYHFRKTIRKPLYVFSDSVYPAIFIKGKLEYATSFGTRIKCVFNHIRENRIEKSVIVTDGYIEKISSADLNGINTKNISVIISASGSNFEFKLKKIKNFILPTW